MREEGNQFFGSIPRSVFWIWLARVVMVVFCGGCLLAVWWSLVVRLQPVTNDQREKTLAMTRLSDDVDQLRLKLNAEPVEQVGERYKEARGLLFADQDQVLNWQDDTTRQASDLGLNIKIDLSAPQPYPGLEENVALVQANVDISPVGTGFTNSAYERLLQFAQALAANDKRCDLMTFSVEGNFKAVQHASAAVQLMAEAKGTN